MIGSCTRPPALSDIELSMFLDQEADHAVVSHLNGCPYCLARANALGHTQHDLKGQYYRHSCPEPELLRDYEFGLLEPAESVQLSQHLALCPHCSRELLKYFQADLPAASIELFKNDQDSAKTRPDTQVVPINPAADLPRAF